VGRAGVKGDINPIFEDRRSKRRRKRNNEFTISAPQQQLSSDFGWRSFRFGREGL